MRAQAPFIAKENLSIFTIPSRLLHLARQLVDTVRQATGEGIVAPSKLVEHCVSEFVEFLEFIEGPLAENNSVQIEITQTEPDDSILPIPAAPALVFRHLTIDDIAEGGRSDGLSANINVGQKASFITYLNLSIGTVGTRIFSNSSGTCTEELGVDVGSFLSRYPKYPIARIQLEPGEGLFLPVQDMAIGRHSNNGLEPDEFLVFAPHLSPVSA